MIVARQEIPQKVGMPATKGMSVWLMRRVGAGQGSPEAIAKRLRALRGALKKTQKEMTAISGSRNRGQKWANYETLDSVQWRRIGLDSALRLCAETDVTLEWIYRGDFRGLPEKLASDIRNWRLENPNDD